MKKRTTLAAIGGYQPFLFCIGMYLVALCFSIFVCSAIFQAINPKNDLTVENRPAIKKTGQSAQLLTIVQN